MTKYVVGFLFDNTASRVLLLQKQRPEWQKGFFNGPGGKIEIIPAGPHCNLNNCSLNTSAREETPVEAMSREFFEEIYGVQVDEWETFASISGIDWQVFFLRAFSDEAMAEVERKQVMTQLLTLPVEVPGIFEIKLLDRLPVIPNLRWLIPMALEQTKAIPFGNYSRCTYSIEEVY